MNHDRLHNGKVRIDPSEMNDVDLLALMEAIHTAKEGQYVTVEGDDNHVRVAKEGVVFDTDGWYEVLLRVDWDSTIAAGTRFSHTKIPGQEPLHSEAINALVLAQLSQGRQLLRGNSLFGPDRTTSLVLEVWQDSGELVKVSYAELVVRELCVPWSAA